jgi:hypothetical protein
MNLPQKWLDNTVLVVQSHELEAHEELYGHMARTVVAIPDDVRKIAPTRKWIFEECYDHDIDHMVMLDDDLNFAKRRVDDPSKFFPANPESLGEALEEIEGLLSLGWTQVGMGCREGGNRAVAPYLYNTRLIRVAAYKVRNVIQHLDILDKVDVMGDHGLNLTLLLAGYANVVMNKWVHDQSGGSNAPGGCSEWRDLEVLAEGAHRLKELFPDFVSVSERETKGAWGGGTRTDTRMRWKKAAERGGCTVD